MANYMAVAIIGCGVVGSAVVNELLITKSYEKGEIKIFIVTNSRRMVVDFSPHSWKEDLHSEKGIDLNYDTIQQILKEKSDKCSTIIDCTSSEAVSDMYEKWIECGINVVTSNKKAFSGSPERFAKLVKAQKRSSSAILFESTVCAGLPVICTINSIIESGDTILKMEGILSGTLSYIFNSMSLSETETFSRVVRRAKSLGYTEPDPRDDLSGVDFARKVVILGRISGYNTNLEDVHVVNLVAEELRSKNISKEEFIEALCRYDNLYETMLTDARRDKCSMRYTFTLDHKGECSVKLNKYPQSHQFSNIHGSTNIISITTKRFSNPITIMGPGAGGSETSFGIISDVMRVLKVNHISQAFPLSAVSYK